MSNDTIPEDPIQGGRVFKRLSHDQFETLADNHEGYQRAKMLADAIDAGWTASVESILAAEGVHLIGFEAIVEGDTANPPFPGVTGAVGLTVVWVATAGDPPFENPFVYTFALQDSSGPTELAPAPTGETTGGMFVAHFAGDAAELTPEGWCARLSTATLDTIGPASAPTGGEFVTYELESQHLLLGLTDVWYGFGGDLTIGGNGRPTVAYENVRYRHFEWLVGHLGLRPKDGGSEAVPNHGYYRLGPNEVPTWAALEPISGEFAVAQTGERADEDTQKRRDEIVRIAKREETDWTNEDGTKKREHESDRLPKLESYYGAVTSTSDAKTRATAAAGDEQAWSAVFISYVVKQAGVTVTDGFNFSLRHITFTVHALANRLNQDSERPIWLYDVDETEPEVGDILCMNRKVDGDCTDHTFESLKANRVALENGAYEVTNPYGNSHTDIVVSKDVRGGTTYIETIGGNTSDLGGGADTVGRKRFKLDTEGHVEYRVNENDGEIADQCSVFGIIRVISASDASSGVDHGSETTVGFELTDSVGRGGTNNPDDIRALKQRLVDLGYDWLTVNKNVTSELKDVIDLVQSIKNGDDGVSGDGRVDVPGPTYDRLRAGNAPRWQEMPQGRKAADGFFNYELTDQNDDHDFGTDWMANTIRDAGEAYRDAYLITNPNAAPLTVNDVSRPRGGETPDHAGHETGMTCDLRLPRTNGKTGGTTWNSSNYDRSATRAMLKAVRAQPLFSRVLFNDTTLIGEGLCQQHADHDNHIHFAISPPTLNPDTGTGTGTGTAPAVPARFGSNPLWHNISGRTNDIKQLQADLWNLGFWFRGMIGSNRGSYSFTPGNQRQLTTTDASGDFNAETVWALREFQIYAGMNTVARHIGGGAARYVDNLQAVNNTARYTGQITGLLDGATAQAIQHWRGNNLRCPVVVEARSGPNHGNVVAQNIWVRDAVTSSNPRMFTYDVSGYYTTPTDHLQFQDAQGEGSVVTGDYVPDGPRSVFPQHVLAEGELTPENLIGVNRNQLNTNNAMQATYKVVRAVSEQECMGFADSVNSWDNAVVSLGPCHWTYRLGNIRGPNQPVNRGELGGFFSYLKSAHGDRAAFDQAVGRFGIDVGTPWGNDGNNLFRQRKYTTRLKLQYRVGSAGSPTQTNFSQVLGRDRNYFRNWHWFYRLVMAGRFADDFRHRMWHMARLRLRDIRETVIGTPVPNIGGAGGRPSRIGDVFDSEMAMALLLRWHIYRPAFITSGGTAGNSVDDAYNIAHARSPTGVKLKQDPTAWTNNNPYGRTLVNGIIERVPNNTFNRSTMTSRTVHDGAGTLFENKPSVAIHNRGAVLIEKGRQWEWRGAAAVVNFPEADHKRGLLLSLNHVLNWPPRKGGNHKSANHPGGSTLYQILGTLDQTHGSFELDYDDLPQDYPYSEEFDPRTP